MATVLIVEDDALIALSLAQTIEAVEGVRSVLAASVAEAKTSAAKEHIDLALLDVNVIDGTTYGFARDLITAGVQVAFTTGSNEKDVPSNLAFCTFFRKPCRSSDIVQFVRAGLDHDEGMAIRHGG